LRERERELPPGVYVCYLGYLLAGLSFGVRLLFTGVRLVWTFFGFDLIFFVYGWRLRMV
jgi:hypothetical protein